MEAFPRSPPCGGRPRFAAGQCWQGQGPDSGVDLRRDCRVAEGHKYRRQASHSTTLIRAGSFALSESTVK